MRKIAFITASPETVSSFLTAYIAALCEKHEVHVITSLDGKKEVRGLTKQAVIHDLHISRAPDIFNDIKSLIALFRLFKAEKFDAVHSVTPKAGLLTQVSAYIAGIRHRFHTFTGQVWVTKTGLARSLLKSLDKITGKLATFSLVDSPSQRDFLLKEKVLSPNCSAVLQDGSISGVNIDKFNYSAEKRKALREEHRISEQDFAFLFVGRLNREKGVYELIDAFSELDPKYNAKLFILGSDEEGVCKRFEGVKNIHYLGFKTNVDAYYSFADVLTLPSHREGFGNVIIEAAACQLPAVASNIYGLSDAVEDGKTGLLHKVNSPRDIRDKLTSLLSSPALLKQLRANGRQRVVNRFDEQLLVKAFIDFYNKFDFT